MTELDYILDEYAKRGILDGNAVERISAASMRDMRKSYDLLTSAKAVVDAVLNDYADEEHQIECRSAVILQGVHNAKDYFTDRFNDLVVDLKDAIECIEGSDE